MISIAMPIAILFSAVLPNEALLLKDPYFFSTPITSVGKSYDRILGRTYGKYRKIRLRPDSSFTCSQGAEVFGNLQTDPAGQPKSKKLVTSTQDSVKIHVTRWGRSQGNGNFARVSLNGKHVSHDGRPLAFRVDHHLVANCYGQLSRPRP